MIGAEMSALFNKLKDVRHASSNSKGASLASKRVSGLAINDSHASLFRHNLDWAHPLTVQHRIYNLYMQQLYNFNHLSHYVVKSTLGLLRR